MTEVAGRRVHEALRARLEAERTELRSRLADVRETQVQSTDAVTQAVGSQDDVGADLRVADALDAQFRDALEAVELALSRIDEPSFGRCTTCERPIPVERLLAVPETRHCVTCSSAAAARRRL